MEQNSLERTNTQKTGIGYGTVYILLVIATAIELGLTFTFVDASIRGWIFIGLSLIKAALVVAYYMHLRQDSRIYLLIFLLPVSLVFLFAVLAAIP
jgi:cytochrome c oxidase subunit IV